MIQLDIHHLSQYANEVRDSELESGVIADTNHISAENTKQRMPMKIIYHNDLDGHCAAAIAYIALKRNSIDSFFSPDVELIEAGYSTGFPLDSINRGDAVMILDFSVQPTSDWDKLLKKTRNVIWIDHHETAINARPDLSDLRGIREVGVAACVLTWRYFYDGKPLPEIVKYIADMDVWTWQYPETDAVCELLKAFDTHPDVFSWETYLVETHNQMFFNDIIDKGKLLVKYRDQKYKQQVSTAYTTKFNQYNAIVCNCAFTGSWVFNSLDVSQYDLMITYNFDGNQWTVTLYTAKDNVHCGKLAQKYGGGGHQKAAGFQCKKLPKGILK